MPNWKKMAEAFGRAMNERVGKDTGVRRTVNKSSIASDANEPGITGIGHPNSDEIASYRRGQLNGTENFYTGRERAGFDITESPSPRTSDVSRSISRIEDENSDARLAKDFEDAFNSAVERHGYDTWKKGSGGKPLDDIRAQMIEELKSGVDLSDFFEKYR